MLKASNTWKKILSKKESLPNPVPPSPVCHFLFSVQFRLILRFLKKWFFFVNNRLLFFLLLLSLSLSFSACLTLYLFSLSLSLYTQLYAPPREVRDLFLSLSFFTNIWNNVKFKLIIFLFVCNVSNWTEEQNWESQQKNYIIVFRRRYIMEERKNRSSKICLVVFWHEKLKVQENQPN